MNKLNKLLFNDENYVNITVQKVLVNTIKCTIEMAGRITMISIISNVAWKWQKCMGNRPRTHSVAFIAAFSWTAHMAYE